MSTINNVWIRWEVWVNDRANHRYVPQNDWRFNACFEKREDAEREAEWYLDHGYLYVDVRIRTTRYQDKSQITTGTEEEKSK